MKSLHYLSQEPMANHQNLWRAMIASILKGFGIKKKCTRDNAVNFHNNLMTTKNAFKKKIVIKNHASFLLRMVDGDRQ